MLWEQPSTGYPATPLTPSSAQPPSSRFWKQDGVSSATAKTRNCSCRPGTGTQWEPGAIAPGRAILPATQHPENQFATLTVTICATAVSPAMEAPNSAV